VIQIRPDIGAFEAAYLTGKARLKIRLNLQSWGTPSEMADLPFLHSRHNKQEFEMSSENKSPDQQDQNKKMHKSQDRRLQTKQEGDSHMNENEAGDVAESGTGGSSYRTGSA
jgi:hypothetical protein